MGRKKRSENGVVGTSLQELLGNVETDVDSDTAENAMRAIMTGKASSDLGNAEGNGDAPTTNVTAAPAPPVSPAKDLNTNVYIDDLEVLQSFIEESTTHLEAVEEKIVRLERDYAPELVNDVFRAMHTVKGTALFFGENVIATLSHRLESILDRCRDATITVTGQLTDVLLAGTDELVRLIGELSSATAGKNQASFPLTVALSTGRVAELVGRIAEIEAGGCLDTSETISDLESSPARVDERAPNSYGNEDEIHKSFVQESADQLAQVESDLLTLEKDPADTGLVARMFRHIHTIKGNAGFLGLTAVEGLAAEIEDVLDAVRLGEHEVSPTVVSGVLRLVDSLGGIIRDHVTGTDPEVDEGNENEDEYHPLGEVLVDMGVVDSETVERALDTQERKLGEILVSGGTVSAEQVDRALQQQKKSRKTEKKSDNNPVERQAVRVDVDKLDRLFELVGELIMAEAMVVSNPDLEGLVLERFNRSAGYLGKITRQMQEITMAVRMIPLEGLFNKMRRLVRDLSRKTGKPVDISVTGQHTEMDRNVIEVLADPLVHMIRNCVDHGIESETEREAAGKEREGRIRLGARYEGSEIWISIRDDGRGLRRDEIVAKAVRRGLTTEEDAARLPDADVWEFLFQPGFSTKEQVTDVSGRGVGMDVVKRNIESLRGRILVTTEPGLWTEFILRIPLTLAILDGVTTRVGQTLYAVPLNDIQEFQQVLADRVRQTTASGEVLELREEIIPIVRLKQFFSAQSQNGDNDEASEKEVFIVAQSAAGKAALMVDEIIGYSQIVVKSLPEYLGRMKGLTGYTVLGNGDVSLIIDTNSLVSSAKMHAGVAR